MRLEDLPTPALLLDLDVLEANLAGMQARCRNLGVALRPHVKTHKCLEIAERQVHCGARGLTVATLEEARAFAAGGFSDLTWAFPVVPGRIGEARDVDAEIREANDEGGLGLLVDHDEAVDRLEAADHPFTVFLEVDCGDHRSGVDPRTPEGLDAATRLARRLAESPRLAFAGLLTHSGHAYHAVGEVARRRVAEEERDVLVELARRLAGTGLDVREVSVGSTPAMTAAQDLTGVTEARPGNYSLFDRTQVRLGSCTAAECAATVLASVVSRPPGAGHAVVDAGALALSKDAGPGPETGAEPGMGRLFADLASRELDSEARLVTLSQEHGVLAPATSVGPVGSRVRILPNHSCLTVACFDRFTVVRGEEVVGSWTIRRER